MRPLSARNPRLQRLAKLARRPEERAEQRAFIVEGPTLLAAAVAAGAAIIEVYVDETAVGRPSVIHLLGHLPESVEPWLVPGGTLDRVGDAVTSQGVIGVVGWDEGSWPAVEDTSFVLVLVEVSDPGNAGTLLRAGVASGVGALVVTGGVDPTSPKVVRSSAGAMFGANLVRCSSGPTALERLRQCGYRTVAMVVEGGQPHDTLDLTGPVALVVGNEARGLSNELVEEADVAATIEMAGPTESLNVAMAGTVMCFEVLRQRRAML